MTEDVERPNDVTSHRVEWVEYALSLEDKLREAERMLGERDRELEPRKPNRWGD